MKASLKELRLDIPRNSRRRDAVISAFAPSGKHLTVDEIYERTRAIDPKVGYTTVWRTLKLLESCGKAASRKFNDGFTRYEYIGSETHHDHLICVECGKVEEFLNPKIEEIQLKVASTHGFEMTAHKMEIYGRCRRCSVKRKKNT